MLAPNASTGVGFLEENNFMPYVVHKCFKSHNLHNNFIMLIKFNKMYFVMFLSVVGWNVLKHKGFHIANNWFIQKIQWRRPGYFQSVNIDNKGRLHFSSSIQEKVVNILNFNQIDRYSQYGIYRICDRCLVNLVALLI